MKNLFVRFLFLVMTLSSLAQAHETETVLSTYECANPHTIGSTLEDGIGLPSLIKIQKRQQGEKIYFVYMENIFPSFEPVDQGVFEDIGEPWGRTKTGLISSVKDKNIFLASADYNDLLNSKALRITRVTLQDYSICEVM